MGLKIVIKRALLVLGAIAALLTATPAPTLAQGGGSDIVVPKIEYTLWRLENGLTVIALPDETTANVTTSMWYAVGSKHDPEGLAGLSHLFEHVLSRKTVNMPLNFLNRLTEGVGGQRNASTWIDRTNYHETVPAQYLETMLWTHRERMAFPVIDSETLEREREIVKEELRERVFVPPYGRFQRIVVPENAFDVLPMRRPGIGTLEGLNKITLEDARAFHQAFYGPDTATLIVAGNFEVAKLKSLVERYFADVPPRANPASVELSGKEPELTKPRFIASSAPNVALPLIGAIWKAPPASHKDAAALQVLEAVLAGGENSRFNTALIRTGKALNANHYNQLSKDGGVTTSYIVMPPEGVIAVAAGALNEQLELVQSKLITKAELKEAKNGIFAAALSRRQTAMGRAFDLGEALLATGDPDAADEHLKRVAAVTRRDVRTVARKWLNSQKRVLVSYSSGPDNPASYANPNPRPVYGTLPKAVGAPLEAKQEGDRTAPPVPGNAPSVRRAKFAEARLSNAIPVALARVGTTPISTITVVLPGGNASDPRLKAGLAAMVASLADNGTPSMNAMEIAAKLESLGATLDITTLEDGIFASVTAPDANLEQAGAVLADIVQNASFPKNEFAREQQQLRDGSSSEMQNPRSIARMVMRKLLYGDAPYGFAATPASLSKISRSDLIEHRETWWHPSVAKIVVSGGIEASDATALLERLFGGWQSRRSAPRSISGLAGQANSARTVVIDMPGSSQAAVLAGVVGVAGNDLDFYPMMLLNAVLGGGSTGRLFEEVRNKRGLSYGAYSKFALATDSGLLTARAQTKNESVGKVVKIFLEEFKRLANAPVSEEELQRRRLYLAGIAERRLETSGGFNGTIANLMLRRVSPGEAYRLSDRLAEVSPEDVTQAAKKYLDEKKVALVVVGDARHFLAELRALRGEVEVISATDLALESASLRRSAKVGATK